MLIYFSNHKEYYPQKFWSIHHQHSHRQVYLYLRMFLYQIILILSVRLWLLCLLLWFQGKIIVLKNLRLYEKIFHPSLRQLQDLNYLIYEHFFLKNLLQHKIFELKICNPVITVWFGEANGLTPESLQSES